MDGRILSGLGKITGLAGIALGVFLLVGQGVLEKQFLPTAGLTSGQAFAVIQSLMILTFGTASIGVIAWLISRAVGPQAPVPGPFLGALTVLVVVVIGSALYIGAGAGETEQSQTKQKVPDSPPAPTTMIATTYLVCVGQYAEHCPANAVHLGCGSSVQEWAKNECKSSSTKTISSKAGHQCGYSVVQVSCVIQN